MVEFEMIDGGIVFINPASVHAIAPAHQQSSIAPGQTVPVGTMLVITGAQFPLKGTPREVMDRLNGM